MYYTCARVFLRQCVHVHTHTHTQTQTHTHTCVFMYYLRSVCVCTYVRSCARRRRRGVLRAVVY